MIPSVAGCTTGSLCPRCPSIWDRVLSLYSALVLFVNVMMEAFGNRYICQTGYVQCT
jgi:hypothetical protein